MTPEEMLRRLSSVLAGLFPGGEERQQIAQAAGLTLDAHALGSEDDSVAWWRAVLSVLTEEQVTALLEQAIKGRPGSMPLMILRSEYERWVREQHKTYRSAKPVIKGGGFDFGMDEPVAAVGDVVKDVGAQGPVVVPPPAPTPAPPPPVPTPDASVTTLRLDAAVPERVTVGRAFIIVVQVCQLTSPKLNEPDLPVVKSGETEVEWPSGQEFVRLRVQVSSALCTINGDSARSFRLRRGHDSPPLNFELTPTASGPVNVLVELYQEEDLIGAARVNTTAEQTVMRLAGEVNVVIHSETVQPAPLTNGAKLNLARALLRCPTVSDRQSRDAIVNDLPEDIRLGVSRSDSALLDVQNIITRCVNYTDGLKALIQGVRGFEGDSLPMAEVERVLTEIGWAA